MSAKAQDDVWDAAHERVAKDRLSEQEDKAEHRGVSKEAYKFHDFVVESLPFRSTTQFKTRSQITTLKYAEYEHEWPDMPQEGAWIGCVNNVIQKELVMIGKVVAVVRTTRPGPSRPQAEQPAEHAKSRKRKKAEEQEDDNPKLSDVEFEVQVVVLSPYGFSTNDAPNDPRWKPKSPDKTTIRVPFSATVCRVRHDPDGSFRRSRW